LNPRHFEGYYAQQVDEYKIELTVWWSQEGILNYGVLLRDYRFIDQALPLTIAVWDGGTRSLQQHKHWISETCASGRAIMVLDVTGAGNLSPAPRENYQAHDFYGIIAKMTADLLWLNDSLAAMRIYDVTRALDAVELFPGIDKRDIQFYACGRHGLYAQLAAVLDKRVTDITMIEGMGSYASWVGAHHYDHYDIFSIILPGLLQYFDLPDIEQWQ
jgi:hypothetical protein